MTLHDGFSKTQSELNDVSPSFCVAKWKQVTLHLGIGTTHSCHHPAAHHIPLVELKRNPGALHNTIQKKHERREMLEGKRPSACDYCWKAEDAPGDHFSDRITKSHETWAKPFLNEVAALPWDADVYPSYLEVDFSTTCNFKCAYCSPSYSTTWAQEIKKHGTYKLTDLELHHPNWTPAAIPERDENPYINAFWEWWPEARKHLHHFRITGGEPLLSPNTFRVLDDLIANPQPQLEFSINSNLGVPTELVEKFIGKLLVIQRMGAVKSLKVFTSNEAHGKQAEYIRFGMDYGLWLRHCHMILDEVPRCGLTIMAAVNVMSHSTFGNLLADVLVMKKAVHDGEQWPPRVVIDTPFVRWPEFLAPWIGDELHLGMIEDNLLFMRDFIQRGPSDRAGFADYEIHRYERLRDVVQQEMLNLAGTEHLDKLRTQFAEYVTEYDKRRGTDFARTFPEEAVSAWFPRR
jgi:organic radical activating enzyme